jgi:RNA polymerase sigma-70 factor, ECF subfamily
MTATEFQYNLLGLQDHLMRFAYQLTADKEDAKDLVQDTFLKALKYCDKFLYESNFKAWTCTIMKNTFLNNYNRWVHHNTYSDRMKEHIFTEGPHFSNSAHPDSEYTVKEIEKAIEALDDHLKVPFKMHRDGFKYKEIADNLDLSLGTVKSRIYTTRMKLKSQLNK